ncbi:hypothetical protein Cfor_11023 [Coptotermes formosanus]|uniref:Uncharacterized protein n=1 Tax=Coptotermes formosanus TaxID=36987 RepID=A0A6L2Q1Q6_COPFO|nr:hypothetical protein Cfor_11023 [Coptotermes formosanus]
MSLAVLVYTVYSSNVLLICWFGTQLTQRAESVRDAAFGCDWVGTPVPFQRCLMFIIATANKEFQLTAGKFVPVSNLTMMNAVPVEGSGEPYVRCIGPTLFQSCQMYS